MSRTAHLNTTEQLSIEQVAARSKPRRRIEGISAVLMPFRSNGKPDYEGLASHFKRTVDAGLVPAVNMDTGYVNLLTPAERADALAIATAFSSPFVAGAYVEGGEGDMVARYRREIEAIETAGGTAIIFQCSELIAKSPNDIVATYRAFASDSRRLLAFELGQQFAPFGSIYNLDTVRGLMEIEAIVGLKHSSLSRELEWQRLALRDEVRPEFKIYTGNDLAIDMVMYGSDYLLGLSSFSPEAFALRDRFWADGDARFYQLNDLLQYLGFFAFRPPTPAYKHSAAQFLKLMGHITSDTPPPGAPRRPDSDRAILTNIADRMKEWLRG